MKIFVIFTCLLVVVQSQSDEILSCKHRCLHVYDTNLPCQCNDVCADYGNCCDDFFTERCNEASFSSCENRCKVNYDYKQDCQCNDQCPDYGNCCADFEDVGCPYIQSGVTTPAPPMSPDSCAGRCGDKYNISAVCQCDRYCIGFNDCCQDAKEMCPRLYPTNPPLMTTTAKATTTTKSAYDSCLNRCGDGLDNRFNCQCNTACKNYGDCCPDYDNLCLGSTTTSPLDSCRDRCGDGLDNNYNCQCNSACVNFGDCCADYEELCQPINFDEFVTQLWAADVNRIPQQYYSTDYQAYKEDYGNYDDLAPNKLFTSFNESYIYNQGTFNTFIELCDNYEPFETIPENDTAADQQEVEEFLDDIFSTQVMTITTQQLITSGIVGSELELRNQVREMWFTHYNRKADFDSSGFEHVFCGEFKTSTSVNGFHNWVIFYQREKTGNLNYHGWTGQAEPGQLGVQFEWDGAMKSRSSIMLGVSPEFEFAVFTSCWLVNPNTITTITVTDESETYILDVQTYVQDGKYVGSCYFAV
ncbi:Poly(U)-specific endoribonuclease [Holothuria leucospilota]|uniref:Uridylate-specific endoribonuclease n=1 Tax=Holothuria leucospilota TaxID=206669 RepID=A0A9Q1H597_HOLLE|nr:Poly(U)-specific endoribonuclease [Holothuria leucospilota]